MINPVKYRDEGCSSRKQGVNEANTKILSHSSRTGQISTLVLMFKCFQLGLKRDKGSHPRGRLQLSDQPSDENVSLLLVN